ncbi:MAG: tRNA preQ1(34) S-adenosylmethionine ribosyltransferase-isomerase QueA [Gemmatimonadaceae bacterium]|nr:tRNA preQ1(34) S-adenosylmethionine ribosyltransferase-isomerase QueA [Gemmatimonadaceae bacterium]
MPVPGSRTSDYDFDLPERQIAQSPAPRRDESRLMVIDRASGTIEHRRFSDLPALIPPRDVLVVNRTRVFRARLLGHRPSGAPAEVLLLRRVADGERWEAMVSPGGKLKPGRRVHVGEGLDVEIESITERGTRIVRLECDGDAETMIERHGHIPLPPYIARADGEADAERYQTVYAREGGSVAAPTAGLHFTAELLERLAASGVERAEILLHVGVGTFKPVEADDPADHAMHEEWFEIGDGAAAAIAAARNRGSALWAVGTTSVRALESAAVGRHVAAATGETRIFIRPPYEWKVVDHLVTNFHLPRSTLLMLVAAFAGYDLTMHAYRTAVAEGYRFYSYGDAMVIV